MTIEGPQLHEGQERVVELLKGPAKYITVVAPRQTGKTFLAMQAMLYWGINKHDAVIYFCSPTYQQAKKVMEELYNAIADSGIVKSYNKSDFCIKLKTGSVIYFKSTERAENLRGATATEMIIDEAAYHGEEVWNSVLKPIMLVKGRKVLFISTPKSNNWFKAMYDMGQDPEQTNYASCRMHYTENPQLDIEELEEARRTLPDHIFKAEYEGTFTDSGQSVFSMDKVKSFDKWPPRAGKIYCGIDLGRVDSTVATFMTTDGAVVDIYRNQLQDWSTMVAEMMVLIRKYNATVMVEVNSIGDVIVEQIKKQWPDTHPFTTSSKSKNDIIEGLAVDLHTGNVTIPSIDLFNPLWFELDIYAYDYSPKTRTLRYNAPTGFHDDCVMSLAISNYCRKQNKNYGTYVVQGRR
tara:strand:- start:6372 stop:7592 length:1221 start_codon:yes stop_codon:yes gene_type:complete